jgi:hypothetical protein
VKRNGGPPGSALEIAGTSWSVSLLLTPHPPPGTWFKINPPYSGSHCPEMLLCYCFNYSRTQKKTEKPFPREEEYLSPLFIELSVAVIYLFYSCSGYRSSLDPANSRERLFLWSLGLISLPKKNCCQNTHCQTIPITF